MVAFIKKGFTLIELLIVVAIIAILAAIAVPNFLEAQVRAKVSRVKNDMRALATALESYYVDHNNYPTYRTPRPTVGDPNVANQTLGVELTTPIAYITSLDIARDIFRSQRSDLVSDPALQGRIYMNYVNFLGGFKDGVITQASFDLGQQRYGSWYLVSAGPDQYLFYQGEVGANLPRDYANFGVLNYDPTNGTVSFGDIFRTARWGDRAEQI